MRRALAQDGVSFGGRHLSITVATKKHGAGIKGTAQEPGTHTPALLAEVLRDVVAGDTGGVFVDATFGARAPARLGFPPPLPAFLPRRDANCLSARPRRCALPAAFGGFLSPPPPPVSLSPQQPNPAQTPRPAQAAAATPARSSPAWAPGAASTPLTWTPPPLRSGGSWSATTSASRSTTRRSARWPRRGRGG